MSPYLRLVCALLLAGNAWGTVLAQPQAHAPELQPASKDRCRIALDLGSSGIRAATTDTATGRAPGRDIDMLAPLMQGRWLDPVLPAVAEALQELPRQLGAPADCARMGAGFSAWRLAWQQDTARLVMQLAALEARTGVPVLVIPESVEGRYGHESARQALGERLTTSHILDIGGGSLQVAGQTHSFGAALGQKAWHRMLCQALGRDAALPCALQPLSPPEIAQARALADAQLQGLSAQVGAATLTAISRPVTRGIAPALRALGLSAGPAIDAHGLRQAIDGLAPLPLAQAAAKTQAPPAFSGFLLSDLLLVEGVLRAMQIHTLEVAEVPINNLPALLRDDRAFAWAQHHGCYLQRLAHSGPAAYFSDPATCTSP